MKKTLYVCIIAFIVFLGIMATVKYDNFGYRNDLGFFEQIIYNTLHGDFYYHAETLNHTYFSNHNVPLLLLVSGVYYLFSGPMTLVFMTIIFLAVTAIPVYLIAERVLKSRLAGMVFAAGFLLSPLVWNLALFDFYPLNFSPLFFAWAFLFMIKEDWTKFYIALFLLLIVKETTAIITLLLGVFMLFKQHKKHALAVILIAVFFIILSFKIIIPYASGPDQSGYMFFDMRYSYLGSDPVEIGNTIVTNPKEALTHTPMNEKISYLLFLGRQHSFISFLSPEILFIGLGDFLANILADGTSFFPHYLDFQKDFHHSAALVMIFMIAAIYGFRRLIGWLKLEKHKKYLLFALLVLFIYSLISSGIILLAKQEWNRAEAKTYEETILQIPDSASVAAPPALYSHLTERKETLFFSKVGKYYDSSDADYVIVDKRIIAEKNVGYREYIARLLGYEQTWEMNNIIILKKNTEG